MDLKEAAGVGALRHPWETSRADFFVAKALAELPPGAVRVLDVGSGDGWLAQQLLAQLPQGSQVDAVDALFGDDDLQAPLPAGMRRFRSVPDGESYQLILLLDVLEHVPDDVGLLQMLAGEPLAARGRILLSVPAWPQLFANHDRFLHHLRRYTPGSARQLVLRAGLRVERCGGLFHSLIAPRVVSCLTERLLPRPVPTSEAKWRLGPLPTQLLTAALRADNAVSSWLADRELDLPGLSFWAVVRRV